MRIHVIIFHQLPTLTLAIIVAHIYTLPFVIHINILHEIFREYLNNNKRDR